MNKQLALSAFAFSACICAGAQQAEAGVSPPVISGTYYEQNGTQGCSTSGTPSSSGSSTGGTATVCQVLFPAPPAGKQLALDTLACGLQVYNFETSVVKDVYLAQNVNGVIGRKRLLLATLQAKVTDTSYYTIDDYLGGGYLVVAPVRIVMDVSEGSTLTMDCHIAGMLRNTPTAP